MLASLKSFASRIRTAISPRQSDQEFDTELDTHLALLTDENVRRGMTPEVARREARIAPGWHHAAHGNQPRTSWPAHAGNPRARRSIRGSHAPQESRLHRQSRFSRSLSESAQTPPSSASSTPRF